MSQLCAAIGIRPTTLAGVLDRLERRGYLTRGARAGDRRAVLIELTPAGRETARTVQEAVSRLKRRALADVPAEAIAGFHRVLQALTEAGPV